MDRLNDLFESALRVLLDLGALIVAVIVEIELWLRDRLTDSGVPRNAQTVILLVLAALLIVATSKLMGGVIRSIIIVMLMLIAFHIAVPLIVN